MQAALSDTCSATVNDLFPQQYNVTEIHAALNRTNSPALTALLPSPFVGFTLILAGDQAFANAKSASSELRCLFWKCHNVQGKCMAISLLGEYFCQSIKMGLLC